MQRGLYTFISLLYSLNNKAYLLDNSWRENKLQTFCVFKNKEIHFEHMLPVLAFAFGFSSSSSELSSSELDSFFATGFLAGAENSN